MHVESRVSDDQRGHIAFKGTTGSTDPARMLAAFEAHLNKSGKVCLKPWCWRRFCNLFKPGVEPPWLSLWWATSTREKRDLFLKQLEYLAYQTDRFGAAYQFLHGIAENNWVLNK